LGIDGGVVIVDRGFMGDWGLDWRFIGDWRLAPSIKTGDWIGDLLAIGD
jgi:hypothetical protein